MDKLSPCDGLAAVYPNSPNRRPCRNAAKYVCFVPDENGNAVKNGERGFIKNYCGLHNPARAFNASLAGEPAETMTFQGVTVRVTTRRAKEAVRFLIRGAKGAGILPWELRDLLARWATEDAATPAPRLAANEDKIRELFG